MCGGRSREGSISAGRAWGGDSGREFRVTFSYAQNEDHFDIKYQECLVI